MEETAAPKRPSRKEIRQMMAKQTKEIVQMLTLVGYRVTIQHDRPVFMKWRARTGGRTIAHAHVVTDMDGKERREISFATFTGVAFCSDKENYDKVKGANIAIKRALQAWYKSSQQRNENDVNDITRTGVSGTDPEVG